jgi:hypothetical protein
MEEIKIVRMTSGEEVLCNIKAIDRDNIIIEDPTVIIPTQDNSIGLAPWMPYGKTEEMVIKQEFIAFMIDPVDELAEQYRSIHSKIVMPNRNIFAPK